MILNLSGILEIAQQLPSARYFHLKIVCKAAESQELLLHTEDMNLAFGELILSIPLNLEDILPTLSRITAAAKDGR